MHAEAIAIASTLGLSVLPWRIHEYAKRHGMTEREEQLFALAVAGARGPYEAAAILMIGMNTAKTLTRKLLKKLSADSMQDAVIEFFWSEWPGGCYGPAP